MNGATKKWLVMKITSGMLIPLMVWFIINFVSIFDSNHSQLINFFSNTTAKVLFSLFLIATFTLGLSFSSERIVQTYTNAAKNYLDSKYDVCKISKLTDLGGRIFEIFYVCESYKEVTK